MVREEIIDGVVFVTQTTYYVYPDKEAREKDNASFTTSDKKEFNRQKYWAKNRIYKCPDANQQDTFKSSIIRWLCDRYNLGDYPHSHTDRWITYNIWDNELSIGFDFRQMEHIKLFDGIPTERKGTQQRGTGKLVNEKTLYFKISELIDFEYPDIIDHELLGERPIKDNDGDWFSVYSWEVKLSDRTSILYTNQTNNMDLEKGDYNYNSSIQSRAFHKFLDKYQK